MSEFKKGRLRIGRSSYIVKDPRQAVAISYKEAAAFCGVVRKRKRRGKKLKKKA
jgi:hypothetical protein